MQDHPSGAIPKAPAMFVEQPKCASQTIWTSARELCVAAGIDPESRVGEGRGMPAWCTFRDAARREQMLKDASEAELSMQAPE